MFFKVKILSLVVLLILCQALSVHAQSLADDFIQDPPENEDLILDAILLDEIESLADILDFISGDPSNDEYYDKAAQMFAKQNIKGIKVFIDGDLIDFSNYDHVEPILDKATNRTLVPIRALSENLGAVVDWNVAKKLITIVYEQKNIQLTINSKIAKVNGKSVQLDVPAKIINGRTMVPLRFISEAFNKKVGWHPYSKDLSVISIVD